ncbi:ATP-binding protein [Streptomyces sp. H39-S7]|uniref:ATP-binding protein n=1 Tax=Streptomyces sp. H39-S7 TaxID=3004357 RepID=UPI0022AF54BC|nr:ATP-binding protein [Streptomyces sp. H39-S7]MCZ4120808.1 ATP-binding protein [Streptomyces sp. H39-S7]
MPTLVTRIVLAGTEGAVSPARRAVVEQVRVWGVPLDEQTADAIGMVASELITNAVLHGGGRITIGLYHQPGRLIIDVLDESPAAPLLKVAEDEDESGRGMALVASLATRSGWEPAERGKHVWAEITLPKPAPAIRAAVLRRFFSAQQNALARPTPHPFALAVA